MIFQFHLFSDFQNFIKYRKTHRPKCFYENYDISIDDPLQDTFCSKLYFINTYETDKLNFCRCIFFRPILYPTNR